LDIHTLIEHIVNIEKINLNNFIINTQPTYRKLIKFIKEVLIMQRFSKGMVTGILIGAAVEMAMMPYWDRRPQRTMKRAGRRMRDAAESTYHGIQDWIR
jgi:hypothetical protein